MTRRLAGLWACALLSTACNLLPAPGAAPTFACDVEPILKARCQSCHGATPSFGAPLPLATFADLAADSPQFPGQKVHQRVAVRVAQEQAPMPQAPNPRLDAAQVELLKRWSDQGAPQGSAAECQGPAPDAGSNLPPVPAEAPCPQGSEELLVTAPDYAVPLQADDYECWSKTVTIASGTRQVFRLDRVVDDPRVVHHVVVFRDTGKNFPAHQSGCGVESDWQVLYAWAPGAGPMEFPSDVGLPIANGDQLVVQLHYNNAAKVASTDSSGARLCLTSTPRARQAGVIGIGAWNFTLPPLCPRAQVTVDCLNPLAGGANYQLFTTWPHMHLRGRQMLTTVVRNGQDVATVVDRKAYDFNSQYMESINLALAPGETLRTRCTWDTSKDLAPVGFGEGTNQEMCFNFLYMTPPPPVGFCPPSNQTPASCP